MATRIAREWHIAAALDDRGGLCRWRWIDGPLIKDDVLAGVIVTFVLAVGDVEITLQLCPPGSGTRAMRLVTSLHFGPTHVAAGLSPLLLALAGAPVIGYFLLADGCLRNF